MSYDVFEKLAAARDDGSFGAAFAKRPAFKDIKIKFGSAPPSMMCPGGKCPPPKTTAAPPAKAATTTAAPPAKAAKTTKVAPETSGGTCAASTMFVAAATTGVLLHVVV